jgi:FAD/FMN-containing dehydrogenase
MQNQWLRFLFGKWMLHSGVYAKLMHFFHRHPHLERFFSGSKKNHESVIQDVLIPVEAADKFLDFLQKNIPIKPIWICPMQLTALGQQYNFCPLSKDTLYIDFGLWGSLESLNPPGHFNRLVERQAVELSGLKSLYSSSYYTEEEFWSIYDGELYKSLKAKYDPKQRLSSLYVKCCSS